jgi:hypothetical protein
MGRNNIMSNLSINSITSIPSAVTDGIVSVVPKWTSTGKKTNKAIAWIGQKISSPENRFILGATALATQPWIDLKNKHVDEDTRKVSVARTVAKIIAGTLTGVLIRSGCIKAINSFSNLPTSQIITGANPKLKTLFTPSEAFKNIATNLKKYREGYGTLLALFVMMFTNFLIDAPLTKVLTNKFVDVIRKIDNKKNIKAEKEVNNNA